MLGELPRKGEKLFPTSRRVVENTFTTSRRRIAKKLQNPRLERITFHTLRHWKATIEYHRTKDLLHVKQILGHRKVDTTTLYVQIEKALFSEQTDEFYSAVAKTVEEARRLVEAGFDYVCDIDGVKIFKKRK
ncbi:tyrosine-type recombinase/integrase [Candidatus Bathyarchaeota archaeon]|nr:tyrosine-type recombinase/integrase [Candidatus Bathyarchaeota archaeon]MBS7612998.1 tyrosine-type recombinase/integrase [Candidatus Bathyarchaeota archaeon]MBS7617609.1 tyrosine-type recombinase/integrase [Candidatus Bathyarchaeota archaeon]